MTADGRDPTVTGLAPPDGRRVRLAVGLGDPERERRLLSALSEAEELEVVDLCLSAEELLVCVRAGRADALVVARDLVRLTAAALAEIAGAGLPLVLLAPPPLDDLPGVVLPLEADGAAVRAALREAVRGGRASAPTRTRPAPRSGPTPGAAGPAAPPGAVLALAGPPGSPGRTTLALNLAAALGGVATAVLVDADTGGPAVGASLDLDLSHNACMVAHADPTTERGWDRALAEELQPLHPACAHGVVLCGVPKPELRGALTVPFLERLVGALRERHRYVVLDTGPDLLGSEAALHRAALALADRVVLVAGPDVVSLWRARTALGLLQERLGLDPARLSVVVNRHSDRFHHSRSEIEESLGLRLTALLPFDQAGAERAIEEHRPMALDGGSKAGFYLIELAGRVHGARIDPPPEPRPTGRRRWALSVPGLR